MGSAALSRFPFFIPPRHHGPMSGEESVSLLVVGAGPVGLAVGIAARQRGIPCLLLDKGAVVSAIERYPLNMRFFSTPERLELGDIPFIPSGEKPSRTDGLLYYRRIAEHFSLDVRVGERVTALGREADGFVTTVLHRDGERRYRSKGVVVATGYYDTPNLLGVPGEDLPHVHHYFTEGHRYWHRSVIVIGAGNSAVDAALECWRAGARVTIVHFLGELDRRVKAWVLPDIQNRIKEGSIGVRWHSRIRAITPDAVEIDGPDGPERLPADAVLAMTGYRSDTTLLEGAGVPVDQRTGVPAHDPETMMTPVAGLYVAGVLAAGRDANRLFIENTREHGDIIVGHFARHHGSGLTNQGGGEGY